MRIVVGAVMVVLVGCGPEVGPPFWSGPGPALDATAASSSSSAGGSASSSASGGGGAGGDGGAGGVPGDGGAAGDGGATQECVRPADCPGEDTACSRRTCPAGSCWTKHAPAGTPLAEQTRGDCLERRCDGRGGEETVSAPDDVADDGLECTADTCGPSGPAHELLATGTPCSAGLCQDSACVDYIPVRCSTDQGTYQDCFGFVGSAFQVAWQRPDGAYVRCPSREPGYCAPGWRCLVQYRDGTYIVGNCL
ncbi:hypothetical protein WME76_02330 [Sorangium sp. So ce119]|uniref:hypothetical protein n=1 Tax=Sorangium sp. So ce119 TaxID=3133279 RepID=UPI003F621D5B